MINEQEYFIHIYTTDGTPIQLYTTKDYSEAEDRYNRIKREKDTIVIDNVPREDLLALALCRVNYRWGKQTGTECLRRVAL